MLKLITLNESEICSLYERALSRDFPSSELKSLSAILNLYRRNEYQVLGAYSDTEFVGYALLYLPRHDRFALLDYLAVEPEYRGRGIGTALLKQLKAYYADTIDALLIECERPKAAPDEMEARKRIRYYTNAGCALTSVRIWLFGVEYSILVLRCSDSLSECDWAGTMLELYRQMLPSELYEHNVRLIQG